MGSIRTVECGLLDEATFFRASFQLGQRIPAPRDRFGANEEDQQVGPLDVFANLPLELLFRGQRRPIVEDRVALASECQAQLFGEVLMLRRIREECAQQDGSLT